MHTTLDALTDLRRELTARGWMRKATSRIVLEWLLHLTVALAALWVFATCAQPAGPDLRDSDFHGRIDGISHQHTYVVALRHQQPALGQRSDHVTGLSRIRGMSACYWRHKHCVLHHSAPNVIGVDSDIDLSRGSRAPGKKCWRAPVGGPFTTGACRSSYFRSRFRSSGSTCSSRAGDGSSAMRESRG